MKERDRGWREETEGNAGRQNRDIEKRDRKRRRQRM